MPHGIYLPLSPSLLLRVLFCSALNVGCSLGKMSPLPPPRFQTIQGGGTGWERGQCCQLGPGRWDLCRQESWKWEAPPRCLLWVHRSMSVTLITGAINLLCTQTRNWGIRCLETWAWCPLSHHCDKEEDAGKSVKPFPCPIHLEWLWESSPPSHVHHYTKAALTAKAFATVSYLVF